MPEENFKEYAIRINDVMKKWLAGLECTTFEGLVQTLVLENFYGTIPKELCAMLKDKHVKELSEASILADELNTYRDKVFTKRNLDGRSQGNNDRESRGDKDQRNSNSFNSNGKQHGYQGSNFIPNFHYSRHPSYDRDQNHRNSSVGSYNSGNKKIMVTVMLEGIVQVGDMIEYHREVLRTRIRIGIVVVQDTRILIITKAQIIELIL